MHTHKLVSDPPEDLSESTTGDDGILWWLNDFRWWYALVPAGAVLFCLVSIALCHHRARRRKAQADAKRQEQVPPPPKSDVPAELEASSGPTGTGGATRDSVTVCRAATDHDPQALSASIAVALGMDLSDFPRETMESMYSSVPREHESTLQPPSGGSMLALKHERRGSADRLSHRQTLPMDRLPSKPTSHSRSRSTKSHHHHSHSRRSHSRSSNKRSLNVAAGQTPVPVPVDAAYRSNASKPHRRRRSRPPSAWSVKHSRKQSRREDPDAQRQLYRAMSEQTLSVHQHPDEDWQSGQGAQTRGSNGQRRPFLSRAQTMENFSFSDSFQPQPRFSQRQIFVRDSEDIKQQQMCENWQAEENFRHRTAREMEEMTNSRVSARPSYMFGAPASARETSNSYMFGAPASPQATEASAPAPPVVSSEYEEEVDW